MVLQIVMGIYVYLSLSIYERARIFVCLLQIVWDLPFWGGSTHSATTSMSYWRSVQAETKAIKASHLVADFLNCLNFAIAYPAVLKLGLRKSRRLATAVLTYAGEISRGLGRSFPEVDGRRIIDDNSLVKLQAAHPVRDNASISVGMCIN